MNKKFISLMLAGVIAASTCMMTVSAASTQYINSNMSGDIRKVTVIESTEGAYTLEVGKEYDFAEYIKVYESAEKLITNHSYIDYSITGSTSDFRIDGSTVTALRADREATLVVTDGYSNKVKTLIKLKSVSGNGTDLATGFEMDNRTNVIYNSASGTNVDGFTLKVKAYPDGAVFTQKDKEAIGEDLSKKLETALGIDKFGSLDNINSSFKVKMSATGTTVGNKAEFKTTFTANSDATAGATSVTFDLDIGTAKVTSDPVDCTVANDPSALAALFGGKEITLDNVDYTIAANGAVLTFTSKENVSVALPSINNLLTTVTQSDGGTAVTWVTEQNAAANVKTLGMTSGKEDSDGVTLSQNTAPVIKIGDVTITGAVTPVKMTLVKDIASLFNNVEFRYGNVQWVITVTGTELVITPKPVATNYESMSEADKALNNSANDIRIMQMPAEASGSVNGVTDNVLTFNITDIDLKATAPTNPVVYRFKGEDTDNEDRSIIEVVVDDPIYFTNECKNISALKNNATIRIEIDEIKLENSRSKTFKASTTLTAVDAVEAKAIVFPRAIDVKVGEKKDITPEFYPSNANVFGSITLGSIGDEYAVITYDDHKFTAYGVNATSKAQTTAEVIMTTTKYGTDRQTFTVNVQKAELKDKTDEAVKPKLETAKVTITVGDKAVVKAINADGAVKWEKDANGSIIDVTRLSDTSCTVKGLKVGTTKLTAVFPSGEKLVCEITVKAPVTTTDKETTTGTDNPQTGDSWFANIFNW